MRYNWQVFVNEGRVVYERAKHLSALPYRRGVLLLVMIAAIYLTIIHPLVVREWLSSYRPGVIGRLLAFDGSLFKSDTRLVPVRETWASLNVELNGQLRQAIEAQGAGVPRWVALQQHLREVRANPRALIGAADGCTEVKSLTDIWWSASDEGRVKCAQQQHLLFVFGIAQVQSGSYVQIKPFLMAFKQTDAEKSWWQVWKPAYENDWEPYLISLNPFAVETLSDRAFPTVNADQIVPSLRRIFPTMFQEEHESTDSKGAKK
jgi:hypothetical protein